MLSTDTVAVERIERVGTKRFFKVMLAVLQLTFDIREPDYACAVWTIASIIKACAALESRGIDSTGIQSMLASCSMQSCLDLHQALCQVIPFRPARNFSPLGEFGGPSIQK
jgi:hypothetical protein